MTEHKRPERPPPPASPATSDLLAGRYVLEEHIAVGTMATVWRAHDEVLARTVAIKVLDKAVSGDPRIRARFRREAVAAAKLVHPGIVSLFDTGVDGDRVYLVIEFVAGQTLRAALTERTFEPDEVARIGLRIASALAYAHDRGIIHRDVKPSNVLLTTSGGVKVTDFGIARVAQESALTLIAEDAGPDYTAPEQQGTSDADARSDLYALGLVLFELLTGRGPTSATTGSNRVLPTPPQARDAIGTSVRHGRGSTRPGPKALHPRRIRADVPRGLDDLVARLTAPDPHDRPVSADDVVAALHPYQPLPTVPKFADAGEGDDAGSLRSELRWLFPVAGLLALAAALVGVGILRGQQTSGQIASLSAEEVTPAPAVAPPPAVADATGPETVQLALDTVVAYDPQGDGSERDRFLADVLDGDPTTFWATERYDNAALGNLKSGVGFHLDLGGTVAVSTIAVDVPRGGFDVEFRTAGTVDPDPASWTTVTAVNDIGQGRTAYPLSEPSRARYLLVWITGDLQPFEGQFRAEVGEVEVEALAS